MIFILALFVRFVRENHIYQAVHGDYGAARYGESLQAGARDELPQSGTGRTIMTAEPKFVPEEAAEIALPEGGACRVRRWTA